MAKKCRKHILYKGTFIKKRNGLVFNSHVEEDIFSKDRKNVYYLVEENILVTLTDKRFVPLTEEEMRLYNNKKDAKTKKNAAYLMAFATLLGVVYFSSVVKIGTSDWFRSIDDVLEESGNPEVSYPDFVDRMYQTINEGETNYQNKMYRMLVYFYFLLDEEAMKQETLTMKMVDYVWNHFEREEIGDLYYQEDFNYEALMQQLMEKLDEDVENLALLQEVSLCLEQDLLEGNIDETSVEQFIEASKKNIKMQDIDAYRTYCYYLEHQASIDGPIQFKILSYMLENDEESLKNKTKVYIIKE